MNVLSLLCLFSLSVYLFLGIYVMGRDPYSRVNRIFFIQALCLAVWAFGYAFVYPIYNPIESTWFWFKLSSFGWIPLPALCLHFALILTGKDRELKNAVILLLYLPVIVELIRIQTGILTAYDFAMTSLGMVELIRPDFWVCFHILYYVSYQIIFYIFIGDWGKKSALIKEKHQAKLIISALLFVFLFGLSTNLVLPVLGYKLPGIAPIIGVIWAGAIFFAIQKYKLMSLSSTLAANELLERVTDLVLLVNPTGTILQINKTAKEMLGYTADKIEGIPLERIVIEVDRLKDLLIPMEQQASLTVCLDLHYLSTYEEAIPVKAFFTSITDSFGDYLGVVAVAQDMRPTRELEQQIMERDRAEMALRTSEERYRDLFENANDVIYTHNPQGTMLSINRAAEKLTGYSRTEISQINVLDVVVPEHRHVVEEMMLQNKENSKPTYYEVAILNKQGKRVELELSSRPIWENGTVVAIQGIARDTTERKRIEERLKYLSMHDSLTGLYNRAYYSEELLRMESGRCNPVGLVICDIDDLKAVNDTLGHAAGDDLIINTAALIKSCFRSNDVVARIGGDEFGIVLPHSDEAVCLKLVEKIRSAVVQYNTAPPSSLGISIGFSVRIDTSQTMDDVMKEADNNMYADKACRKKALNRG